MDNKKQLRNILVYLGIPIMLFIIIFMMMNGNRATTTTVRYSDILSYFDEGKVSEYTLDWGTGDLLLTLNDSDKTKVSFRVPSVTKFDADTREAIAAYNADDRCRISSRRRKPTGLWPSCRKSSCWSY